ncbi:MAG: thiamine pyrophosphate-dependent enzyme, partial [Chloroflexota bacterium]|nr:thiamine pyrophosphate-dependent enzyme [Chloroflexota bacterium]
QGCQHGSIGRLISESVEELGIGDTAVIVGGVGCHAVISFLVDFDAMQTAHGRPPDVASAAKRVLPGKPVVMTIQGDGDAISIGTEPLIQAAARAERITVIVANNGCYGTTGGQMAPTSIMGQITTTTPKGRASEHGFPIHIPEMLASLHGVAYSARGALSKPVHYQQSKKYIKSALQKQMDDVGFSFVEILSACPPNWRLSPVECVQRIEDEVISVFPLGEFKNVDSLQ